jgi:hypothetical protein
MDSDESASTASPDNQREISVIDERTLETITYTVCKLAIGDSDGSNNAHDKVKAFLRNHVSSTASPGDGDNINEEKPHA